MDDSQQVTDMLETIEQRTVEYVPPKPETIRAFALRVCEELAKRTNDSTYIQPHVIHWLANLLELAVQVRAKQLNAAQLVDSDEE
jgi:hypothetical protein